MSIVTSNFLITLPGWLLGYHYLASLTLPTLLLATRKKGLNLLVEDLRLHRMEKRSIFQHSEDCYMTGGEIATFVKKRREKLRKGATTQQSLTCARSTI